MDYITLGKNIRRFRKERGLTQETLAEMVFITPVFLSQIETSSRKPSMETVLNVAKALNISLDILFSNYASNKNLTQFIDNDLNQEQFNIIATAFKKRSQKEISALIKAFTYLLDFSE